MRRPWRPANACRQPAEARVRVLLVGPPSPHLDHAERTISALGHDVVLVSYDGDHPRAAGKLPLVGGAGRLATICALVRAQFALRRLIRRHRPDLVHAHWLTGPGWIAAAAGARPLVVSAWGSDALRWTGASRLGRALAQLVARRAAAVTYDADAVQSALQSFGFRDAQLVRLVFGIDVERFRPGPPDEKLLARLGVDDGTAVILSPRGLDPVYRTETVVEAFAQVAARRKVTLLVRVPPGEDGRFAALRDSLHGTAAEHAVVGYENVEPDVLPALLRSVDVMVSVPESDGSSVLLLQALACGTPVVVSDLPANREWVRHDLGSIVPVGDPEVLARALESTLADPKAARARSLRAAARVADAASLVAEREILRRVYAAAVPAGPSSDR
jgi:glycosyltransferase involved in cell wall biosynthesis